jgi:hypothetical protein
VGVVGFLHFYCALHTNPLLFPSHDSTNSFSNNYNLPTSQTEIHTAEPLVPEPSDFEVELDTEKPKIHKSPGIDQIPAKLSKA